MVQLFLRSAVYLLFFTALISTALALYAWRRRAIAPGTWAFALLMLAVADWALGYALELWSRSLSTKVIWTNVRSLGMATAPVLWLVFAIYYAGKQRRLSGGRITLLLGLPLILLVLLLTNSWHHLVWRSVAPVPMGPLVTLRYDLGPTYWIAVAYAYLCVLSGAVLLILTAARESLLYRWQAGVLILAALLPMAAHIVTLLWEKHIDGLNLAPFAFSLSGLLIALNAYGFRFLKIMPIAHQVILEHLWDGVIVLDRVDRIVHLNPAAEEILGQRAAQIIGMSAGEVLATWPDVLTYLKAEAEARETIHLPEESRYIDLSLSPLRDSHGHLIGRLLVLRDVTEQYVHQQALRRRDEILQAVAFTSQRLLQTESWDQAMKEILARLGQAADVSRVYIFENHKADDGTLLTSQRYEWVAPGITPQIDNPELQNFPWVESGFERWVTILSRGEAVAGLVREFPESERAILELQDIRSILVLPIFVGEQWWGFIGFDECRSERRWDGSEQEALRTAANAIGVAIQRRQTEKRLQKLAMVAAAVTSSLDLNQVLDAIATSALQLVNATDVHIYLYDRETGVFTFGAAFWEDGRRTPAVEQPRPHGLTATVARTGKRIVIDDATTHPLFQDEVARQWGVKSIAGFPLLRVHRVVGVLTVAFLHEHHRFTEDELYVLSLLADQAAIAIDNAQLHEEVRRQAITDGLTGLYNHRYFYDRLSAELMRSMRYRHSCSLIMLDLDDFKSYNDRYGHLAGDDLLRELGGLLHNAIRHSDIAARYGGEEFALILPETNERQALALAKRLLELVRNHEFAVRGEGKIGKITVSIGVASYPAHARDVDGLVQAADMALLRAKKAGKNHVCVAGR